ncbi:contactin-1a-like isoform X1 [Trematomus bernacchii]|uniref:contactin-1a-like isoform X1 n=1 Tax=Trematomus bernacchii TaxID=40690 RepID=UPI00146A1BD3|nr:contactin-1a-like isoform X1 [Trematomus bernacchii]XP_034001875.1 contactin-1a-like isoform X1 [Trematomus bernacchii]XP_034001876.1 contactin-1a-like isoform X1 [Trematomus bernacchii]
MLHLTLLLHLLVLPLCFADASTHGELPDFYRDEATGYGPVFEEQPVETIYPEESPEAKITMSCRARANPPATYKWILEGREIDMKAQSSHYRLVGGNLVISNPIKTEHVGEYLCLASNLHGTIISRKASVQFGYLDLFSSEERESVYVKEGQGAVLLCAPPPHYPAELSFRWILNEFPTFIPLDKRRFVSQITGNLYISKVDSSDSGNYSCIASSQSISKSVFSNYIPLVPLAERPIRKYPADLKVKFPDTIALVRHNITLECFALGNPVPEIRWKKLDGQMPPNHEVRMAGAHLHLYNVQFEDGGSYQCEAVNSRGKDYHAARLSVEAFPEWVQHISSSEKDLGRDYTMSCKASGTPEPSIRWLINGEPALESESEAEYRDSGERSIAESNRKDMRFSSLAFGNSGMYQCIAENHHGIIYANAELRVYACAPTFKHNPLKDLMAPKNGRVVIECRPKAAPKPTFSWSKGTELLSNSTRVFILEDGSLEILNVTRADKGRYTCFAENDRGKANSTGDLLVTDSTKITLAPANADVKVGETIAMQCAASHDTTLDITFIWSLDGRVIDLHKESQHYERTLNGSSNGELLIKNVHLKHTGRYTCTAQTPIDNMTASAHLVVRGPPGAPGGVRVMNKTDKSVMLQWSRGADNHNPITKYTIQYRDSFSKDVWKNATTSPADVEGNTEMTTVADLIPWIEYEFRVIATSTLGTGEPSSPSHKEKTLEAIPVVAPSDVGGGGGTNRELTITWTPVQPQYYYGPNFGYIVAFKPHDGAEWMRVTLADPQAKHYVHKDAAIPASTEFQVKVKAFNSRGEGPFSLTASIYSAQDAPSEAPVIVDGKSLSATEGTVRWLHLAQSNIDGYQVKYWRSEEDSEGGAQRVVVSANENSTRLEGMKPFSYYLVEVRAYNSAGFGPASEPFQILTKRPPPSRAPKIIGKKIKGDKLNIAWEMVEPIGNEASINGYKVLYRRQGHTENTLFVTNKEYINLPLPEGGNWVVEVRAFTEGGDGAVSQIYVTGGGVLAAPALSLLSLLLLALLCLNL